jgi:hypothetical protein
LFCASHWDTPNYCALTILLSIVGKPGQSEPAPMTSPVGHFVHMALAHAHLSPPEVPAFAPALPPNKKIRAKVAHPFLSTCWQFQPLQV